MATPNNLIRERVAEFLAKFPPFNLLTEQELLRVSNKVTIRYVAANVLLFEENAAPKAEFYVVRQGSVRIYQPSNQHKLIDVCDEGDVFGVRPLIAREPYLASATTKEECLLYVIPVEAAEPILLENAKVSLYFAAGFASGKPQARHSAKASHNGNKLLQKDLEALPILNETIVLETEKEVLSCNASESILIGAQQMAIHDVGSLILVNAAYWPIGIVTDKDLRKKVVAKNLSVDLPLSSIMSSPVKTVRTSITMAEAMIEMVQLRAHHLVVTADGSINSRVVGIISDHDLLLVQGFNPAIMIKEVRKSTTIGQLVAIRQKAEELLAKYLEQDVNISYISTMITAITDAVLSRLVDFYLIEKGPAPVQFCWLQLGSMGREEQLLRTDQDHALLYAGEENKNHQEWFLGLAQAVSAGLEKCGFEADPAGISANNPAWCLSLNTWKNKFSGWVNQPDETNILNSTIFFDYRAVVGEKALAIELSEHLFSLIGHKEIFLSFLAKNALATPPPLSFFRNFVVENNGDHKDEFDLKLRALLPLVDAARLLTLHHKIVGENSTIKRFHQVAMREAAHKELLDEAALSFEILLKIRARFGLKNASNGRYINPNELNKLERQTLRNIFSVVKELQEMLAVRFQVRQLY